MSFILFSLLGLADINSTQVQPVQSNFTSPQVIDTYDVDLELAQRFVPVFYFHPDEIYYPQPVDVVMGLSRMRQNIPMWFDTTIVQNVTVQDLLTIPSDETYFLDQWFWDTGSSEYGNYSSHKAIYETIYSPQAGGPAPAVYAHVVRDEDPRYITIQYWIFYFYNDWFNKHEGDWELVEVILNADAEPQRVVFGQHHGGVSRDWESVPKEEDSHPVVYVARGSHANYFAGNEVYLYDQPVGNQMIVLGDWTGISERTVPRVILIPTRDELAANPDRWSEVGWLNFRGRWGETGIYSDFNGPTGPADKGEQWDKPLYWGLRQPLDEDSWYKNRLQVEISGTAEAHIALLDELGQILTQAESIGNLAILHTEPSDNVLVQVDGMPATSGDLIISWPDQVSRTVTRMTFSSFTLDASGHAQLKLSAGQISSQSGAGLFALKPALMETFPAHWDAPDLVIASSALPIHEILVGLFLSFLISVVPILVLVAILYWVDWSEKEPVRLLVIAFAWGAIPSLLIAFLVQLFFKLPFTLMGPNALQIVRLGLLAPVLEEVLKAAGVLFIFWRFRREINDVLDGMIYGAMVGFGFAFISNLFRYAGNFMTFGFPALNLNFIAERTVYVLNQGLYTAIFGAGLGFAMMTRHRQRFWLWIIVALVLSIATHALQNLLSNSLVGLNVYTVIVMSAGTLVLWAVAGWSLVQQRQLMRKELQGLFHVSLYGTVLDPLVRTRAQWHALRRHGFRTWIQVRRLQRLCIQLANVRLQARLFPEKYPGSGDADALQAEIKRIFEAIHPVTQ